MRAEREKLNAKITAGALKLSGGRLELPAEMCHIVLFSGGSCTVQCGDMSLLVSPGCALLLGPGAWVVSQAGHTQPEMLGCEFPLAVLHEMKNATGEDFLRLFAPGSQMALYGSVQWASRLRTLLEMMRGAMGEPEYPGGLYLALTLHYVSTGRRAPPTPAPATRRWSRYAPTLRQTTSRNFPSPRWQRGSTSRPTI